MKNIWKLYIIFLFFFLIGDLISTEIVFFTEEKVKQGLIPDITVPDDCYCQPCQLPTHCDASPLIEKAKSVLNFIVLIPKFLYALLIFVFIKWYKFPPLGLMTLTILFILVTIYNLGTGFFKFMPLIILLAIFSVWWLLKYFVSFKEDKNG